MASAVADVISTGSITRDRARSPGWRGSTGGLTGGTGHSDVQLSSSEPDSPPKRQSCTFVWPRGAGGLDRLDHPGTGSTSRGLARPSGASVGGDPEPELPVPEVFEHAAVGLDDPAGRDVRVVAGDQGGVDPVLEGDREHQPQRACGQAPATC